MACRTASPRHTAVTDYATFTSVDLSRLPAPSIVEPLDFETIRADMIVRAQELYPAFDLLVESDPAIKLIELFAYRELLLRARVNDAARAVMVAYANDADLDQLGALLGVPRLLITPADDDAGTDAVYESDEQFRRRIVLAPEGFSVAGPEGAYVFHALSADPDVLDASASSPDPGEVLVTVLSRTADGTADVALVDTVAAYLTDETRRPMTDFVTVQSATIVNYAVEATILTFAGPDSSIVVANANAALDSYIARSHRLGRDVTRAGIIAALYVEGIQNVYLISPAADLVIDRDAASWCTGRTVTYAGVAE